MNVVTLHVLSSGPSADFGLVRLAAPALEPQARVILFDGLPPPPLPEAAGVARVVLQGDVDNHRAYAEQVPQGVTAKHLQVPLEVRHWVAYHLITALESLHERGHAHGLVSPDRVLLGVDGSVTLFGRGRVGGSSEHDLSAAFGMLSKMGLDLPQSSLHRLKRTLAGQMAAEDADLLAALVESHLPEQTIVDQVYMHIGPTPDSLDEVVPDFGPDSADGTGLLDRWAVTTSGGQVEHTDELTGSAASSTSPLVLTLWTALAAPPEHAPPQNRFMKVAGQPSRGMRALLVQEPPDSLPAMIGGAIQPFLMEMPEHTSEPTPITVEVTDPEYTFSGDDDPATAVYHLRDLEVKSVIKEADQRTTLADLRARVSEAERRAQQAERRARAAEAEVQRMAHRPAPIVPITRQTPQPLNRPIPAPPVAPPPTPPVPAWLRPEIVVVALLLILLVVMVVWALQ